MQEELIAFKTAKLAKEKGFNEPCWEAYGVYSQLGVLKGNECLQTSFENEFGGTFDQQDYDRDNFYLAPTQSLLQRWLRETHEIHITLHKGVADKYWYKIFSHLYLGINNTVESKLYNNYEEALEKGLFEALKLIK